MTEPPGGKTDEERAVELAYRAVSARDRTVSELRSWLEAKKVEPQAIEHAVGELASAGFIDDARFAQRFAEDKRDLERWGSDRIERDLRRRGVEAHLIEAALAGQGREDELEASVTLLDERRCAVESERDRDKAWRMLVRKGYPPELAYEAVREHRRQSV